MSRRLLPVIVIAVAMLPSCGSSTSIPTCSRTDLSIFELFAQAVPTATQLPCISELPTGWTFAGFQVRDGSARFWLDSTLAGIHAVEVDLTPTCDVTGAVEEPPAADETEARVYFKPDLPPSFSADRYLVFQGGCVTYAYRFTGDAPPTLALEVDEALRFLPRLTVIRRVQRDFGLILCGAQASPCPGGTR